MDKDPHGDPVLPSDLPPGAIVEMILVPGNHRVVGPPPPPLTEEDLLATLRLFYSEPEAIEICADLSEHLDEPDAIWSSDLLILAALLSPEHWERMRKYRNLTPEQMHDAVDRAKRQVGLTGV
jgi:hypothetical protein